MEYILDLILKSFYLMLPAYFANMAPVIFRPLPFLDCPIDFNKKLKNKPIFGSHKTWRGFFFGIFIALIVAYIQFTLSGHQFFQSISLLDYSHALLIGSLLSIGTLLGDLVESFIKRRIDIKPGKSFFPWDQTDFVFGSLILLAFIYLPSIDVIITIFLISIILHVTTNHIGYYLKIRKSKW